METLDLARSENPHREAFALMAAGPDSAMELALGALLVAAEELEDDDFDPAPWLREIDRMASRVQDTVSPGAAAAGRIVGLHDVLFRRMGFHGAQRSQFKMENALLPRVLERRRGLPIALAVVYIEVARRCGLEAEGVPFPGHFLVRCPVEDGFVIIDPFYRGRFLDRLGCVRLLDEVSGGRMRFDPVMLQPATTREILMRVLANLRHIHLQAGDDPRALRVQERMVLLAPDAPVLLEERATLYARLGAPALAVPDLEKVLELLPPGQEERAVRHELARLRRLARQPN